MRTTAASGVTIMLALHTASAVTLLNVDDAHAQGHATTPAHQTGGGRGSKDAARSLGLEGVTLYEAGKYGEAIERFKKAHSLFPFPQNLVYLARCHEKLNRLLLARDTYAEVVDMVLPANAEQKIRDTQAVARTEVEALKKRIPKLQIIVLGVPSDTANVSLDGLTLTAAELNAASSAGREVDPGKHVLVASAADAPAIERAVEVAEGRVAHVELELHPSTGVRAPSVGAVSPSDTPRTASQHPSPRAPVAGISGKDVSQPSTLTLSHRWQIGAIARLDVEGQGRGALGAFGVTFGLGDHVEAQACALVGRDKGIEPGITAFVLRGAFKPMVSVGVPIFIADRIWDTTHIRGAWTGIRGAAGLQWDPIRHFGVFSQAGASFFPDVPAEHEQLIFVLSAGVQGRL